MCFDNTIPLKAFGGSDALSREGNWIILGDPQIYRIRRATAVNSFIAWSSCTVQTSQPVKSELYIPQKATAYIITGTLDSNTVYKDNNLVQTAISDRHHYLHHHNFLPKDRGETVVLKPIEYGWNHPAIHYILSGKSRFLDIPYERRIYDHSLMKKFSTPGIHMNIFSSSPTDNSSHSVKE